MRYRKKPVRRIPAALGAAMLAASLAAPAAQAQDWPTKPVTIVVPFNPGAANDTFGRGLAQALSETLGQPFIVENRQGASGFVGASHVSRSAPDGYTLVFTSNGITTLGRSSAIDLDVFTDLTPITMAAQAPTVFTIPTTVPANTVKEFIDWANANEGTALYGNTGPGTLQQIQSELFNMLAGTKLRGVPYQSGGQGVTDLAAGRVHLMFVTQTAAQPQVDAGRLKLLAYSGPYAPESAPKLPTMEEAGVKGFGGSIWFGLYGPAGMPAELRDRINAAVAEAVKVDSFQQLMERSGSVSVAMSSAEFEEFIREENRQLDKLVEAGVVTFE